LRHLQGVEPTDDTDLGALSIDHSQLGRGDLFIAPDAFTYGSSDALYLQNSPASARNLFGKPLDDASHWHCSEVFAIARAHGQRI
jgi:hypothetical protein